MSKKPDRFAHFWKELRRRNVFRSLAIYTGTAFIILEACNMLFPRWGLPDWSIDLVFWLLVLGAVINVFTAWVFDLTPQGIQKTTPIEVADEIEKPSGSKTWKAATYLSLVVIVALIVLNIVGGPKQLRAGDIQSLVVLPFENFTGDDQLENMVAGMHSLLIGDMSRVSGLRVIGKTSSRLYMETDMSAGDIANELNVDAVVEATVMCLGDTVCMQFRLVSTTGEEEQLWVGEYHEDKSQILNLYNRITKQIAKEVMVELSPDEKRRLDKMQTVDREAYDAYLSSYVLWEDFSKESLDKAFEYLSQAIKKDPEWAPLYAGMAQIWGIRKQMQQVEPDMGRQMVLENIGRAKELDPDLKDIYFLNATSSVWTDWNWEKGEKAFLKALAINPNDAMSRIYYAHLLIILQRPNEALIQGELAVELDPLNPLILALYSGVLRSTGQFQKALEYAEMGLAINPKHGFSISKLKESLLAMGEYDKAFEYRKIVLARFFSDELIRSFDQIHKEQGYVAAEKEIVHQFELLAQEKYVSAYVMASRHYSNKEYSKALDDLEQGYASHEPNMPYMVAGNGFTDLYDSTRFISIVEKMNLPLPKE